MMQPEELIRMTLLEHDVECFTTLDDFSRDEFCVVVRTTSTRDHQDVNRAFTAQTYNLLLHCFSNGGKLEAMTFADTVSDIIDGVFWHPAVEALELAGGSPFPRIEAHEGYTLNLTITLAR